MKQRSYLKYLATGLLMLPVLVDAQNVGIGTNNPLQKLHVEGNSYVSDSVGIRLINPKANLDILGTAIFRGNNNNTFSRDVHASVEFFMGRSDNYDLPQGVSSSDLAFNYSGNGGGFRHFLLTRHSNIGLSGRNGVDFFINVADSANGSFRPGVGNVHGISITDAGVGIGTVHPREKLEVIGNQILRGRLSLGNNAQPINPNSPHLSVNGTALFKGGNPGNLDSITRAGVEFFFGRTSSNEFPVNYKNGDIAFNFGTTPGGLRHFIATRHIAAVNNINNAFDFYVNNSSSLFGSTAPDIGNKLAMTVSAAGINIPSGYLAIGVTGAAGEQLYVNGTAKFESDIFSTGQIHMGYTIKSQVFNLQAGLTNSFTLSCPAGLKIINGGGGYDQVNANSRLVSIQYNGPDVAAPTTTWRFTATNTSSGTVAITVFCNCARIN